MSKLNRVRPMYLYAGLAFFAVCVLFLCIPFRIILTYRLQQGDDLLLVEVSWLGLRLVRRLIPVISESDFQEPEPDAGADGSEVLGAAVPLGEEAPSEVSDAEAIINALARCYHLVFDTAHLLRNGGHTGDTRHAALYHWALRYFSPNTSRLGRQMERLEWSTTIGLGDAAAPAILAGAILGLKAAGFAWLQRRVQVDPARFRWQVTPNYSGLWLEVTIYCIFRVNAGHIIIMGIGDYVRSLFQRWAWWKKHLGETYSR